MNTDLTGKTALVTGASLGLGRAMAAAFHEAGANVALLARGERRDAICVRRVWRPIMFLLRALPERVFKRLSRV